jgi:hypothetical protein
MVKQLMIIQEIQCLCRLMEMSWPLAHPVIIYIQDMFECIPGMEPAMSRGEVI